MNQNISQVPTNALIAAAAIPLEPHEMPAIPPRNRPAGGKAKHVAGATQKRTGGGKAGKRGGGTVFSTAIEDAMAVARSIMHDDEATQSSRVSALKAFTDLYSKHREELQAADIPAELQAFMSEYIPRDTVKG